MFAAVLACDFPSKLTSVCKGHVQATLGKKDYFWWRAEGLIGPPNCSFPSGPTRAPRRNQPGREQKNRKTENKNAQNGNWAKNVWVQQSHRQLIAAFDDYQTTFQYCSNVATTTHTYTSRCSNMSLFTNDNYRQTQSNILSLQETILNSSRDISTVSSTTGITTDEVNNKDTNFQLDKINVNENENANSIKVDSTAFLKKHQDKFPNANGRSVVLQSDYNFGLTDPLYQSTFQDRLNSKDEYDKYSSLFAPVCDNPFMPNLNSQFINYLVEVNFTSEQIIYFLQSGNSKRLLNNEIWGVDIYTLDSDPLLILKHCGVFDNNSTIGRDIPKQRTPGNLDNFDNVFGINENDNKIDWLTTNYDVSVQFIILDTLQTYHGFDRFGLISRTWEMDHHGLSYSIWQVDFKLRDEKNAVTEKDSI